MRRGTKMLTLVAVGLAGLSAVAETFVTIQPHTTGNGFVVTCSWKDGFATGMDASSNGSNAYLDDRTLDVSANYTMTAGNHPDSLIRYSQHNNDGVNGNYFQVPPLSSGTAVHYDGTNGESLTPGDWMRESSHANVGFDTLNGSPAPGDWYNNPGDYGGVRFFGTGVQGATSLTSWNGIGSSSAYGDEVYEYGALLGDAMQFGVNGSTPGLADSMRIGLAYDAAYATSTIMEGLLIGYFLYPDTYVAGSTPANEFTNQFNVGTWTNSLADITLTVVDDPNFTPLLVTEVDIPEPASMALLAIGALLGFRRRRA
ncbi:MAG: PEP-CTERM sorting domain-containing protein [Lentisphaeria bacterium]|nr:PEP-CTERM sorting domain-containing protein [Lentisphaeria bacterium]